MKKIYLASPLFTEYERKKVQSVASLLRASGFEVYVPMEHQIEDGWSYPNATWGRMVFEEDVKAIRECDQVVCIYYGLYSDSGTAWECGYAYAKGKPIHQLLYGFDKDKVFSLMMVNGCSSWDFMENFIFDRNDTFQIEQK